MELSQSQPGIENAFPYGMRPERDAAIVNAAMGGLLLISLEPAIARIASEPPSADPVNIKLFPPAKPCRRTSVDKPISDLGLAPYNQPQMVLGLARQLQDILGKPKRLQRRGFVAFIPEPRHADDVTHATTSVLSLTTRPLEGNMTVHRHRLVLNKSPRETATDSLLQHTSIETEPVITEGVSVAYRALSAVIQQRRTGTQDAGARSTSNLKQPPAPKRAEATSPWSSLARQRRRVRQHN